MSISNLIKYYRACYLADNSGSLISDFLGNKTENRQFVEEKEELLNKYLPYIPVNDDYADEIRKKLTVYKKELEFVYCSLFIVGKSRSYNKRAKSYISPLLIYPAEIHNTESHAFVKINFSERRLNYNILSSIRDKDEENTVFYNALYDVISKAELIDYNIVTEISKVLERYIPELDTTNLVMYPELMDLKKIRKIQKEKDLSNNCLILPASAHALIWKSADTMGVVSEMDEIAKSDDFSAPIQSMFSSTGQIRLYEKEPVGKVPAILNNPQQNLLHNSPVFPYSLIVGPPGTGKSYTIAALAIDQLSKGNSVLIASRTNQAVDVIGDKIEKQLKINDVIIRAGRKQYLTKLKRFLKNLLNNVYTQDAEKINTNRLFRDINRLDDKIESLESKFNQRVIEELKWGEYLAENKKNKSLISSIYKKFISWKNNWNEPLWEISHRLENYLNRQIVQIIQFIEGSYKKQIARTLKRDRKTLQDFLKALNARTSSQQESILKSLDFNVIFKTFPVWLVKFTDIYRVLPLQKELFDVAIIDEATQCDIATCLPVIQRAKKVIFAGDPEQLRHVSFLSFSRQKILRDKFGLNDIDENLLNYREKSILDVISEAIIDQEQVVFLNEHYRSLPSIIRFSNKHFYSNSLKIMTSQPGIALNKGLELIQCQGKRDKRGINKTEADRIIDEIKQIIEKQLELNTETCQSLGVLSPFRAQVDYLANQIAKEFSTNEIIKHNILIGTAYAFQGEERDVMFLSFAIDNESHPAAFYHINKSDVFNVSITRARSMQKVFYSFNTENLPYDSYLRKFVENSTSSDLQANDENQISAHDIFLDEVVSELEKHQIQLWKAFPIAGLVIDLIVKHNNMNYGIDLIGFPGYFAEAFSIERYKMLGRAGIRTFPLPYSYWFFDKDACFNELLKFIGYDNLCVLCD